jgi:predicted aldo/keto reductase-like oxidoreductase
MKEHSMSDITRREFLTTASLASGTAVFDRHLAAAQTPPAAPVLAKAGSDLVTLGKTGIRTSVLGFGTGTNSGKEQRELGKEGFVRLIREAYDRGIRYIDTADSYQIHAMVAVALKELPKQDVFVQTKTGVGTAEGIRGVVERFRRELAIETLDSLLIHCMTKTDWPVERRPVIDALLEAKEKGRVRAIGVSCHSFEALTDAVANEQMDLHLVRINPFRASMDDDVDKVSAEIAKMHAKNREKRFESLKYVLGLGTVHAFTIGFSKIEQLDETLKLIERATAV